MKPTPPITIIGITIVHVSTDIKLLIEIHYYIMLITINEKPKSKN